MDNDIEPRIHQMHFVKALDLQWCADDYVPVVAAIRHWLKI